MRVLRIQSKYLKVTIYDNNNNSDIKNEDDDYNDDDNDGDYNYKKDNYEKLNYPVDFPDPIEAIKFRMEQLGYNQSDLANVVGLKSRASEILNKKRKLTLDMIRSIHDALNIPTNVLIQSY